MRDFLIIALLMLAPFSAHTAEISPEAVINAQWSPKADAPLLTKAQILLDRAHFSPGEIDGRAGDSIRQRGSTADQAAARGDVSGRLRGAAARSRSDSG